jgi:hypothetical protein
LAFVVLQLYATQGCKQREVACYWQAGEVRIDGEVDDWAGIPGEYYKEQGLVFSVSSDSTNLYLLLSFRNPAWAMAIRQTGLTIWLDPEGGKSKDFGLRYRGGPTPAQIRDLPGVGHLSPLGMPRPDKHDQGDVADTGAFNELRVFSRGNKDGRAIFADGSQGPSASYGLPKGVFCYELSIPLTGGAGETVSLSARPGQMIGIGAHWGEMNIRERRPSRGDGVRSPGRGGPRPGGGFGGPGADRRPGLLEEQNMWMRTRLALGRPALDPVRSQAITGAQERDQ